ncbi:MAG: hypothetical protein EPO25_06950 [Gammaproteobacteria bacterium]|nr:MAG: hypothetical protein EPO25_06950 [Gammaproteobacteria bacterium]
MLSENWLERGWSDTKDWLGRWQFWVAELVLGWGVGLVKQDATAALLSILGLAFLAWCVATISAPWRQRNEARQIAKSFYLPRFQVGHTATKPVEFQDTGGSSEALIFLTVSNRGQPSSLTDWAVAPVSSKFEVRIRSRPSMLYRFKAPDKRQVSLEVLESESIRNRTFTPIPTGGIVSGFLNVWFPDERFTDIVKKDKNASLAVRFRDAFGETHQFRVRLLDHLIEPEEFPSVPGISVRVIRREPSPSAQVEQSSPANTIEEQPPSSAETIPGGALG